VFTVVAMFSERTQTEIPAARKLYAGATKVTRIVVANRSLTRLPQVASWAFTLPTVVKRSVFMHSNVDVVLMVMMLMQFFLARASIAARISQTCQ
jgi:hypothetical protein